MNAETLAELERAAALATPGIYSVGRVSKRGQSVAVDTSGFDHRLRYSGWKSFAEFYGCTDDKDVGIVVAEDNAKFFSLCSPENIKWLIARARRAKFLEDAIGLYGGQAEDSIFSIASHLEASSPQPSPAITENCSPGM